MLLVTIHSTTGPNVLTVLLEYIDFSISGNVSQYLEGAVCPWPYIYLKSLANFTKCSNLLEFPAIKCMAHYLT